MRKILTQEEKDAKKKKKQLIIGISLVFLMLFSTVGYSLMDRSTTKTSEVDYYGVKLVQQNGMWTIKDSKVYFRYLPSETENVSLGGNFSLSDFSGQTLYLVNFNSDGQLLLNNIKPSIERYQAACLETSCDANLPVKNCLDSNLIVFQNSNETKVYKKDKCVFISGDFAKGSDALSYRLLGII